MKGDVYNYALHDDKIVLSIKSGIDKQVECTYQLKDLCHEPDKVIESDHDRDLLFVFISTIVFFAVMLILLKYADYSVLKYYAVAHVLLSILIVALSFKYPKKYTTLFYNTQSRGSSVAITHKGNSIDEYNRFNELLVSNIVKCKGT